MPDKAWPHKSDQWVNICRAGRTIDGRVVSDADIQAMAADYDPVRLHQAAINLEHLRSATPDSTWRSYGIVRALRVVDIDGVTTLQADVERYQDLIALQQAGQKLWWSAEICDYPPTGRPYLTGLAATDMPASPGTTRMYAMDTKQIAALSQRLAALNAKLSALTPRSDPPANGGATLDSLASKVDALTALVDGIASKRRPPDATAPPANGDATLDGLANKVDALTALVDGIASKRRPPDAAAPPANGGATLDGLGDQIKALTAMVVAAMSGSTDMPPDAHNGAGNPHYTDC